MKKKIAEPNSPAYGSQELHCDSEQTSTTKAKKKTKKEPPIAQLA